jgi:hypothetical protein
MHRRLLQLLIRDSDAEQLERRPSRRCSLMPVRLHIRHTPNPSRRRRQAPGGVRRARERCVPRRWQTAVHRATGSVPSVNIREGVMLFLEE